ncbi:MAG: hypothetical protein IT371_28790 [Deltaproteobacteria bacterium]|nr:hypothetical protein [Deltaproteobacteria bacterium]
MTRTMSPSASLAILLLGVASCGAKETLKPDSSTLQEPITARDRGVPKADAGFGPDAAEKLDYDEEACKVLVEGPYADVEATTTKASAGEVKVAPTTYRVGVPPNQVGFLKLSTSGRATVVLYLDLNLPFEVQDAQGKVLPIYRTATSVLPCVQVRAKHALVLPAAGSYAVKLGPDPAAIKVMVVVAGSAK